MKRRYLGGPLPPRMEARPWADGTTATYRFHQLDGTVTNLGTDREAAIAKVAEMTGVGTPLDALDPAILKETWLRHRKGAKQRGIPFEVTVEDVSTIVAKQFGRCAVTRLPFSTGKPEGLRIRPWLPSLDRKVSRRGYTPANVRVVCAFVNVAMNGFGEELFRQVLEPLIERAVEERLNALGIPTVGNESPGSWESRGKTLKSLET